jgi:hypothetical protein
MVVLFEFQPDLFRYSSGGSVGGVDDRDQVTGPQDISGEVAVALTPESGHGLSGELDLCGL